MTRNIDFSKPLSEAELAYVNDRPWLIQDARLRGEDIIESFDVEDDDNYENQTPAGAPSVQTTDRTNDDDSAGSGDETEDDEADDDTADEESDEDEVAPYAEWDYAALKTEAGNRGLAKTGSKEQLIERLEENDESSSE